MQFKHAPAAVSVSFDDPNLVSAAGLVPVMALAQRCGLTVRASQPALIARAARRIVVDEPALTSGIRGLRAELSSLGGAACIVREVEELVG